MPKNANTPYIYSFYLVLKTILWVLYLYSITELKKGAATYA